MSVEVEAKPADVPLTAMRTARDKSLEMPRLILPSIQVNIRRNRLPDPESNGARYLKLPLNVL